MPFIDPIDDPLPFELNLDSEIETLATAAAHLDDPKQSAIEDSIQQALDDEIIAAWDQQTTCAVCGGIHLSLAQYDRIRDTESEKACCNGCYTLTLIEVARYLSLLSRNVAVTVMRSVRGHFAALVAETFQPEFGWSRSVVTASSNRHNDRQSAIHEAKCWAESLSLLYSGPELTATPTLVL